MAKNNMKALFLIALLLFCSTLTYAARPEPGFSAINSAKTQHGVVEAEQVDVGEEISCDGIPEEECLMRRTLVAHTDYIYTQKQKP